MQPLPMSYTVLVQKCESLISSQPQSIDDVQSTNLDCLVHEVDHLAHPYKRGVIELSEKWHDQQSELGIEGIVQEVNNGYTVVSGIPDRRQKLSYVYLFGVFQNRLHCNKSIVATTSGIDDFYCLACIDTMVSRLEVRLVQNIILTFRRIESSQNVGDRFVPIQEGFHSGEYLGLKR